ncbi:hypothetical protein DL769_000905 [Monosporascus sp. CRB-8-3]|nr:hypothetical protein DL769_000905 [Monosporascus sp. CRB-8-3]
MRPQTITLVLFIATASALDTSPPCIKSCYDSEPPLRFCEDIPEMTDETLARCTCSSFLTEPPLYECIRECPESEQATYAAGLDELCQRDSFPDITIDSATTAPSPTSAPDEGDQEETATGDEPEPTGGAGEPLNRAAPALLAMGGLVAAVLF